MFFENCERLGLEKRLATFNLETGRDFLPGKMAGDYDYVFKVLVLGDSSVGKSSLIKRFHSNVFDQRLPTTIGVDFFIHDMEVDGKKVKVSCPGGGTPI